MYKNCLHCFKEFHKPYHESVYVWNNIRKYCSKECLNKSKIGKPAWNKGLKGIHLSPNTEFKKGHKTVIAPLENRRTGVKNNKWKGGITPINEKVRKSIKYKEWRKKVFERDNFTCQSCGTRGGDKHADHIKPFALYPELRFSLENGRTLCVPCHKETDTYGWRILKHCKYQSVTN